MKGSFLSEQSAYSAMAVFVATLHGEFGWESIPGLLGSMVLVDGIPFDRALAEDWRVAVGQGIDESAPADGGTGLTMEQAYSAVGHFLEACLRSGQPSLGEVVGQLVQTQPSEKLAGWWREAISIASRSPEYTAATVTKDGQLYEIHRTSEE